MSNKRFLKKLLATTTVVGTLAAGAMEAQAVVLNAGAAIVNLGAPPLGPNALAWQDGGGNVTAGNWIGFDNVGSGVHVVVPDAIVPGIIVGAIPGAASDFAQNFWVGPIIQNAAAADNRMTFKAAAADKTVTLLGISTLGAAANFNTAAELALGRALTMQNAYSGLAALDADNKGGVRFIIDTTVVGFTASTAAAPLVFSNTAFLDTAGVAGNADSRIVVADGTYTRFESAAGGVEIFGTAANLMTAIDVGTGGIEIKATGGKDIARTPTINFTAGAVGADGTSQAILTGDGAVVNSGDITTVTEGVGTVIGQGNNALVVGTVGAGRRIATVQDTRSGAAVASKYGAIRSTKDVIIDHSANASLAIKLDGIDSSAGAVKVYNNNSDIELANGAIVAGTSVDLKIFGAAGKFTGGGVVTAGNGDINITTGASANAQAFTTLTAIKGNTTLKAGAAQGITATIVQTKKLTLDSTDVAADTAFRFGGAATGLSDGLVINTAAGKAANVTILSGVGQYIGNITFNNDNLNNLVFGSVAGAVTYIGNVGDSTHKALKSTLGGDGKIAVIDERKVYSTTIELGNVASTLILGNNTVINADIIPGLVDRGVILLSGVAPAGVPAAGVAVTPGALNANAVVKTTINTINGVLGANAGGVNKNLALIDFGTTATSSSITVNGVNGKALVVNTAKINFSTNAGLAGGTLALAGGTDHKLTLLDANPFTAAVAGNPETGKFGKITSNTTGTLTITGVMGAVGGGAGARNSNALGALEATTAGTVTLTGGDAYIASAKLKDGVTLNLGTTAAAVNNYMIGSLNNNAVINAVNTNAAGLLFKSGTNLGNFTSLNFVAGVTNIALEDGVDLLGKNVATTNPNAGILKFLGTSNVKSAVGSAASAVDRVLIAPTAANTAVTLAGGVWANNGVHLNSAGGGAAVNVNSNITGPVAAQASIVNDSAAGLGVVNFGASGNNTVTVAGDISGNAFASVNVKDTGTTVIQNATTASTRALAFAANGNLTLQNVGAAAASLATMAMTNTSGADNSGTLSIDANVTRTVQIGARGASLAAINLAKGAVYTITNVDAFTGFTTSTNNTGGVALNTNLATTNIGNIGTADALLATANIAVTNPNAAAPGRVNAGNIYATNGVLSSTKGGATFNIGSTGGTLNLNTALAGAALAGASSDIVNVASGSTLGVITSTNAPAGWGVINFTAGSEASTIGGQIGTANDSVKALNLGTGAVNLNANVYAVTTNHQGGVLNVGADSTITGTYVATDGSTLALGGNKLNLGDSTLTGAHNITADLNLGQRAGNVVYKTLDVTGTRAMSVKTNITVDTKIALPTDGTEWKVITVTDSSNGKSARLTELLPNGASVVSATATNSFLKLYQKVTKDGVSYTTKRDLSALGVNVVGGDAGAFAALLQSQQATLTDQALLLATAMGNETALEQRDTMAKMTSSNKVHVSATAAANSMAHAVGGRLATLGTGTIAEAFADDLGAAAGDDSMKMGAWVSGFAAQGNQGARKGIAGFKSKVYGGVVGFDTALNDQLIVGLAAGTANIKTKYKNEKSGDSTKATTYLFSIYGSYDFGNSWVAQASGMFGNGSVKNSALRRAGSGANNYETATAKFDTVTGGGEVLGGYKFNVGDTSVITPLAGLSYLRTSENSYKETGTTFSNLDVSDRTQEKLEGILGARASTSADMDGTLVTPEFHGFMNYDFKAKAPKVSVKILGADGSIPNASAKPARTSWNLGAGVMAKTDMVEYGVTYDSQISDKYFGHQGTLKVRVNF